MLLVQGYYTTLNKYGASSGIGDSPFGLAAGFDCVGTLYFWLSYTGR